MNQTLTKKPRLLADKRLPRYKQIKDMLKAHISKGIYDVGDRLPTVRQICKDFDASFLTAHRAVRELAAEGFVETQPGSKGTVVICNKPPETERATTVACLLRPHRPRNEEDNFGVDLIQGIRNGISLHGYRFVYHCLDEADYGRRMLDLVKKDWCCGIVLDQRVPRPTIEALLASGLPAVLVNRVETIPGLNCVAPDYERIGREGARMMLAKGYCRLGFIALPEGTVPCGEMATGTNYSTFAIAQGLRSVAMAHGLSHGDLHWLFEPFKGQSSPRTPDAYGLPWRKPPDWKPLGILMDTDRRATGLLEAIAMTDLVLGKDIGLIGCLNLPFRQRFCPSLSTWRIDAVAVGEMAAAHLVGAIENPSRPPANVVVPPAFVEGESF